MLKVKYKDDIIKVPSTVEEISLNKGLNIQHIWRKQEHDLITKRELLTILVPSEFWSFLDEPSIDSIISNLSILNLDDVKHLIAYNVFELNNIKYGLHPLDKLSVKEYADIEFYLTYGEDVIDYLDEVCNILFRPLKTLNTSTVNILNNKVSDIQYKNFRPIIATNYSIVEYSTEMVTNSILFKENLNFSLCLYALYKYIEFKNKLISEFPPLFITENKEIDPFEEQEKAYSEEHKEEFTKSFEETWGFYHILNELAPTLSEQMIWLNKDIREFFKYLVYHNEKQKNNQKLNQNNG